jgi:hypothetical protein
MTRVNFEELKELQKDKLETAKVIVVQDYQKLINKFE